MTYKNILITGAGGYVGSKMVTSFLDKGYYITALDRYYFGDNLVDLAKNKKLNVVRDDIRSFDPELLKKVDVVVDLASLSNDPSSDLDPKLTESINHLGSHRVAKMSKEFGVQKYIFSSSCSVYGASLKVLNEKSSLNPVSEYAKSKLRAESDILALADNNFCPTVLRSGTMYGLSSRRMRFDLIVNLMTLHAWKNKKIIVLGGGKQWRPLVHVDDVINAFKLVVDCANKKKVYKEIFNVGSNAQNYQVSQVANIVKKILPDTTVYDAPDDPDKRNYNVNFDKIKNILNFYPTKSVEDGVKEIVDALENGQVNDSLETVTVKYYKHLIDSDKLLSKVKLNGSLF